ncbi:GTP-binding protein [Bifidobacterium actinocoloniiforme DSM 22766]|uniref:Multifunctional fusion protein n=1 Tax=Bifidobacterium actinocoloniiforme DSM 22766 TaxID=1437605 RepID=A0A086Z0G3_9BIFI|nr:bifunctional cytidylate kinase/GTPase Der [Bifidobacterium actinocoloniiforme]AKV55242.1 cytidylate kinase [Bifidobacterium actinocoloniiforme DSM 22766]KFI40013.1 GTP-binding protein [Bifidobacterium actinocoloniiforme DSM 22766]
MITVAIDGPAGVGKSSTSKALAERFGLAYLDTGAMYRAAALWCLDQDLDLDAPEPDAQAIVEAVAALFTDGHFGISMDPADPWIRLDGEDVGERIRSARISSHVSVVSGIRAVRRVLIAAQRAYMRGEEDEGAYSQGRGVVAEGRDITTVVAPEAEVRVLLTARESVRAARRSGQFSQTPGGEGADDVAARDRKDSKVTAFTEPAPGVTELDNSDMTFEQTLDALSRIVQAAIDQDPASYRQGLDDYELAEEDKAIIEAESSDREEEQGPRAVGVLAVVGRPNVGKSTLVNRILGRRAAVVEDTPGVTRDRVTYEAEWAGTDFQIVDTGGWEADAQGIGSAIADQSQLAVSLADAVCFVVDGQVGLTDMDSRLVTMLRKAGKPVVLAVNKLDSSDADYTASEFWKLGMGEPYAISAMHGRGVGDLLDAAVAELKQAERTSGFLTPSNLRRVALVGRPNVGKSSLLNQLAGRERAVVNELAGTTRDPIDEVVQVDGQDWLFIDTAGIKRRLHKISGAEYYSSLRTQAAIERSELALVLFDASQPIADQDLKVMSQAVDAGRAVVLVFNKWDLLDDFGRQRLERLWATEFDRVTWAERVNLSAKTGWHANRLAKAMRTALDSWDQRIPTGKLNAFLGTVQAAHPHPLRGGKQPRILFATQAATRPPRFVIFATGFLEASYRRFLERRLREEFGFAGTPIQLSVHIREKKQVTGKSRGSSKHR